VHRVRAARVGAAGDDAELGAGLLERVRIDVGLGGRLLDVADSLRTAYELLAEEALRALAAVGSALTASMFQVAGGGKFRETTSDRAAPERAPGTKA
jgi:hypothetical protein